MNRNTAPYDKLIMPNGQPQYGRFRQTFSEVNHRDFEYLDPMDRPANRLQRHFGFNQFHFIGLHSQDYTLACAIANVQYVATAFIYLFDHHSGHLHPYRFTQPLGRHCQHSPRPFSGVSRFRKGAARFQIQALEHPNRYQLKVSIADQVQVDVELSQPDTFEPIAVCSRAGYNGWAFTQKHTTLSVTGHILWKGLNIPLDSNLVTGSSDWSCGFMRRETAWNWSSISGILPGGERLGLNLACGVNETSFNENTLWINGRSHAQAPAHFEFNRKNRMETWHITTSDGAVDLRFEPEGCHREKVNAVLVASNFSQLPGKYFGTVTDNDGHRYQLQGINGLIEDHYAKW
ncbi:MAG: DUF2804 domain-containing protein [Pseudomonadota bacterium]|nr:DUF2804 domain-containing protein [Pseudomonadota bacterium]